MSDTVQMSPEYLTRLLTAVPAYTTATFVTDRGDKLMGMARDMPRMDGSERRWTVNGWEWFLTPDTFRNVGIVGVEVITFPNVEVIDY
jgi:hypothetical protein